MRLSGTVLATGLVVAGAGPAFAQAVPPWGPFGGSDAYALRRGCRTGGPFNLNSIVPQWVPVEPANTPVAFVGTVDSHSPAPILHSVRIAHEDWPGNHYSHDVHISMTPDAPYRHLLSDGNHFASGGRLDVEWEEARFPLFAWPAPGDRLWVFGQYVFDCGHPPYGVEIHSPIALASMRMRPLRFPQTGDRYVPGVRADIWVNADGGGATDTCLLAQPVADGCIGTDSQRLSNQDIEFTIEPPPRPEPGARLLPYVFRRHAVPGDPPTVEPVIVQEPERLRVRLPTRGTDARAFAGTIELGWDTPARRPVRRFRVSVDELVLQDPLDIMSADLRLWAEVNENWFEIPGLQGLRAGDRVSVNRSFELTLYNGQPIHVFAAGYEEDCLEDHFGDLRLQSVGNILIDASVSACLITSQVGLGSSTGNSEFTGAIAVDHRPGDPSGTECPRDYGVGAHDDISQGGRPAPGADAFVEGVFRLRYRIEELPPPAPEPYVDAAPAQVSVGETIAVNGARYGPGRTEVVLDQGGHRTGLGSAPVTCGQYFRLSRPLPPTPGGTHTLSATGTGGEVARTSVEVEPRLLLPSDARVIRGHSFAATEPVRVQHWVLAARQDPRPQPTSGRPGRRWVIGSRPTPAAPVGPVPPAPRPGGAADAPRADWVVAADVVLQSDGNGSFAGTIPADRLPRGYGALPEEIRRLRVLGFAQSDYYLAVGQRSGFEASVTSSTRSAATAFWRRFTEEPNRRYEFDPAEMLRNLDRRSFARSGLPADIYGGPTTFRVLEYLRWRAATPAGAALPAATLVKLRDDARGVVAALARRDKAGALRQLAVFQSRLPARLEGPAVARLRRDPQLRAAALAKDPRAIQQLQTLMFPAGAAARENDAVDMLRAWAARMRRTLQPAR
jgi:hypothetical protein